MSPLPRTSPFSPWKALFLLPCLMWGCLQWVWGQHEDWLSHLNPEEAQKHGEAYASYAEQVLASSDVDAVSQLALMATLSKDWPRASTAAQRVRVLGGDWSFVLAELTAWLELGDLQSALEALLDALTEAPSQWTGWQRLPALLGALPDPKKALSLLDELDLEVGDDSHWLVRQEARARLLYDLGEGDLALEHLAQAIEQSASLPLVLWGVELATLMGVPAQGLEFLDKLEPKLQQSEQLVVWRAELLAGSGRTLEAMGVLQQADPTPKVLFYLASLALARDEVELATEAWRGLPASDQADVSDSDAYYTAHLAQLLGHLGQAWTWFGRVAEPPWLYEALLARGLLLNQLSKAQGLSALPGSLETVRNGLHRVRKSGVDELVEQSWAIEALLMQQAGQVDEFVSLLTLALSEAPDDHFLLYLRSIQAARLDDLELAEQDLRRIIRQNHQDADALNALGYLLTDRTTRHTEAYRLIARALQLKPDSPEILDSMGWVHYHLGQLPSALRYLERAYSMSPDPEIQSHLVEVLLALGHEERANAMRTNAPRPSLP